MSEHEPAAPGQPGFVRGNARVDRLLADLQLAAAAAQAAADEMDRVYAMNLAMIRKAAQMTQAEVARKLGVGQGVASRLEHRDDMLLSTPVRLPDDHRRKRRHRRDRPRPADSNSTSPASATSPTSYPPETSQPSATAALRPGRAAWSASAGKQ